MKRHRPPRWYEHANVKRYGWRTWYVMSPRVWTRAMFVQILIGGSYGLGVLCFEDHEDDERVLLVTIIAIEFRFTLTKMWTKRRARQASLDYAAKHGPRVVEQAEAILRGDA